MSYLKKNQRFTRHFKNFSNIKNFKRSIHLWLQNYEGETKQHDKFKRNKKTTCLIGAIKHSFINPEFKYVTHLITTVNLTNTIKSNLTGSLQRREKVEKKQCPHDTNYTCQLEELQKLKPKISALFSSYYNRKSSAQQTT